VKPVVVSSLAPSTWLCTLRGRYVAALLILGLVAGLAPLACIHITALPDDAAFRLYDQVVSKAELKHRQDVLKALYGIQPPTEIGRASCRERV